MVHEAHGWPILLAGTLHLRPYVFVFLAVFLALAGRDLGWRRAGGWLVWSWGVAFATEYASTRSGIPFGLYHYTGDTAARELFVSNVPFFSPLSFSFLAYSSYSLARWTLGQARWWSLALLSGALMMLVDVVVDPLAVLGERWFLGRLFYYVEPGAYFGVPLSNFAGWFLVGSTIVAGYLGWSGRWRTAAGSPVGGVGLYYGVVLFNLGITWWIGEWTLLKVGILVHVAVFLLLYGLRAVLVTRGEADEEPTEERAAVITTTERRKRSLSG